MTIEEKAKPKTSGAKKIQRKKLSAKTTYIPNREIGSIELESGETLSKNDIIDGVYRAKKKFAEGGKTSSQKIYEVEYEIGGKKHTSQFLMYDSDRVENLLPPSTKIISIKEKYAKGGKIGFQGLANKVAKRYVGKKVSKEYQAEYGKTYDAKEAKEVGNKVAGKVYKQQVAKKKIVRKLQRKTN